MILPETPTGFTRTSGYPRGTRSGGADQVIDKFFIDFADFDFDVLAEIEDTFDFNGLAVNSATWEPNENQTRVYVTISYSQPTADGGAVAVSVGKPEYTLTSSGQQIPIDKRKQDGSLWFSNYKTKHNHILAAKKGVSTVPGWWDSSTDLKISDAESSSYIWLGSADSLPDGWYILKDKTKNIENVIVPSSVVVETTLFDKYDTAIQNIKIEGTKEIPGKTFAKTGQWLVTSCNCYQDGRYWKVVTEYQNAPEWDGDYYA